LLGDSFAFSVWRLCSAILSRTFSIVVSECSTFGPAVWPDPVLQVKRFHREGPALQLDSFIIASTMIWAARNLDRGH
jgi:hypothetical protein